MVFGIPIEELLWLVLAIIAGGMVSGTLAGLFGIGGGGVIVPVLYEVFRVIGVADDVRTQLCVGTSIAIIVPTTIRSYRAHKAKGTVLHEVIRLWWIPAVVGVGVGSLIAAFAPAAVFKIAFAVIATSIAIRLLFGNERWRLGDDWPSRGPMLGLGFLVGLASSLMGVSGGSVSNMFHTLYGKPIHNAVATSAGLGVPITIAGTLGYMAAGLPHQNLMPPLSIGFVSLIGVVLMAPVSTYMASYGAKLAHMLPRRRLEVAFGIFLIVISARFVASLWW